MSRRLLLLSSLFLAPAALAPPLLAGEISVDAGRGPVTVHVPTDYDPAEPAPLLVSLHGQGLTGASQESLVFRFAPVADAYGFLYATPTGTPDGSGELSWNGAWCCANMVVDDVAYLSDLVAAISATLSVDPDRVHAVGYSNGAFMAHRLACDRADLFASVASLAGGSWPDLSLCQPSETVNVLQIHGTADGVISYDSTPAFSGSLEVVGDWVARNGCSPSGTTLGTFNADLLVGGDETRVDSWSDGCTPGGDVELWSIEGGGHIPLLTDAFRTRLFDWFVAHPQPSAGPWTDLGAGLAGSAGTPLLAGEGSLAGGEASAVVLTQARADASATLVLGLTALQAPFKGGVFVPSPDVLFGGLPTGPAGGFAVPLTMPPGVPAGLELYFQVWIPDVAGPAGFAASNGLLGTTP